MDAGALGQYLRDARESNEIQLDDVVAKLRIRRPILEAFEAGEFTAAGMSEIQARGMLRNYARHLGLDEEQALELYDEARYGTGKRRREQRQDGLPPAPLAIDLAENRAGRRRGLLWTIMLLLASLAAVAIIVFVTSELVDSESDDALLDESLQPEFIADLPPTSTFTPSPTPLPTVPTATPSNRAVYSGSGVLASIQINQRTWIGVSADGVEQFAGVAPPDTLLEYAAIGEIVVSASNAMGLDIVWNGQQQSQFGGRGQQVDIRFTVDEVALSRGAAAAPSPILSPTPAAVDTTLPPLTASPTLTLTSSTVPAIMPTSTATAAATNTPVIIATPTETAILPPRLTQAGLTATKEGA